MRVVALVSGGKDSCFNMMQCVAAGHEIVALANLEPCVNDEIDSYMYQTVGHDGISMYCEAMGLPLFRRKIFGTAVAQEKDYSPTEGDEVEDLYLLLLDIKAQLDFDAVSVGAILSDYQRIRVENVCSRLGCVSLAYLWRRDQSELLQEMIDCGINAIIVKTASLGLDPDVHLGQTIAEMKPHLIKSKKKYGINVCGEGGEYETFTLDCPLFRQAIVLDEYEKVIHSNDAFAPVGYLKLNRMHLVRKTVSPESPEENNVENPSDQGESESGPSPEAENTPVTQKDLLNGLPIKSPLDHLSDLVECNLADCCDGHLELCSENHRQRNGDEEDEEELECFASGHHHRITGTKLEGKSSGSIFHHLIGDASSSTNANVSAATSPIPDSSKPKENEEKKELTLSSSNSNISVAAAISPVLSPALTTPVSCPCQSKSVREKLHFPVSQRVTNNSGGWFWIMGVHDKELVSQSKSVKNRRDEQSLEKSSSNLPTSGQSNPMKNALASLKSVLEERDLQISDLISVVIYVSEMSDYAQYNKEYLEMFSSRPPVRICVEAPLPIEIPVLLEALAFRNQNTEGDSCCKRQCMHVQGISHWAPANIGPYSQAIWVGDIIYVAGQIGLVPGSMVLVEGGARIECKLALRHISRVIKAVDGKVEMRDVVQGICYVTDSKFIEECRREWEKRTNNAIVEYLVVPRLPRDANVEWQVWVHKHNTAFEYEETGCYIGTDVKVRLIRRWNYECRVAVIVCTALLCNSGARFGRSEMIGMTEYALSKLNQESDEKSQECAIRVFYRLGAVNPSDIEEVLGNQSSKYNVAFSIVPVCFLVKENAVISFCGVRHK